MSGPKDEVTLKPGWLADDVKRASNRVAEWTEPAPKRMSEARLTEIRARVAEDRDTAAGLCSVGQDREALLTELTASRADAARARAGAINDAIKAICRGEPIAGEFASLTAKAPTQ